MFIGLRSMFKVSGIELGDVGNRTDGKIQRPPKRPPRDTRTGAFSIPRKMLISRGRRGSMS